VTNQLGYPVINGTPHDQPGQRIASHKGDDRRRGHLSSTVTSPAEVTATVGLSSTTAQDACAPANLSLIPTPSTLQVGNLSALIATVTDQLGNPVADGTPVSFSTNLGVATSAVAATVNGVASSARRCRRPGNGDGRQPERNRASGVHTLLSAR